MHTITVLCYLCVCAEIAMQKRLEAQTICSNMNDSVNHLAPKELLENPVFVECTQPICASPEIHLCRRSLRLGCGEPVA